jgi:hypothetical protein
MRLARALRLCIAAQRHTDPPERLARSASLQHTPNVSTWPQEAASSIIVDPHLHCVVATCRWVVSRSNNAHVLRGSWTLRASCGSHTLSSYTQRRSVHARRIYACTCSSGRKKLPLRCALALRRLCVVDGALESKVATTMLILGLARKSTLLDDAARDACAHQGRRVLRSLPHTSMMCDRCVEWPCCTEA